MADVIEQRHVARPDRVKERDCIRCAVEITGGKGRDIDRLDKGP